MPERQIPNKSILLVEDNQQDEMLILRALKKVNLANEVHIARDGQQALDYLFGQGEFSDNEVNLPAVVMLDLSLPRVGGLEVLARLRADPRTELLPVAILTSSDEERDRLASYRGGANSFVHKPLDFTQFAEAVARVGVYWMVLNEGP